MSGQLTVRKYWLELEYRVTREMAGMRDPGLCHWWCDGFDPDPLSAAQVVDQIVGNAWFGPTGQDAWTFVLVLTERTTVDKIDWEKLLPREDHTGWLRVDPEKRRMFIEPAEAHVDRE